MSDKKQEVKKGAELLPRSSLSGLLSFDEFDHFFDDFLSRRWPRLLDWNSPTFSEANFPRVDIEDHDNIIEVQAALPGIKKENVEVSIKNQTITIRASTKEEKKAEEKGKFFRKARKALPTSSCFRMIIQKQVLWNCFCNLFHQLR